MAEPGRPSTATPGWPSSARKPSTITIRSARRSIGHNALRAYLLDAAEEQRDVDFTVERHWVSGATVLAAWHVAFVRRSTGRLVRLAGFMTMEVAEDGRVGRFREWAEQAPETAG